MSEKPPPNGINRRSLRRLRERQFIPSAAEDARPGAEAALAPFQLGLFDGIMDQ
jgi:hypothetical protein